MCKDIVYLDSLRDDIKRKRDHQEPYTALWFVYADMYTTLHDYLESLGVEE